MNLFLIKTGVTLLRPLFISVVVGAALVFIDIDPKLIEEANGNARSTF